MFRSIIKCKCKLRRIKFFMKEDVLMEGTTRVLAQRQNLRFKLIVQGAVVGILTGLLMVFNRVIVNKLYGVFKHWYVSGQDNFIKVLGILILLAIMGAVTGYMVRKEPMISGSGIPQVEGRLSRKLKMNWLRILILKFVGGAMALAAGLSVGREGPSVQMGASIGEGFSKGFRRVNIEENFLITSGASAGLAAAFNAPLSGVIFALEEVHKNFSPLVLLSAMAASLMSDFVSKNFLGLGPSLKFTTISQVPLKYYWMLVILGIIVGVSGVIFSKGILKTQDIYDKFKKVPIEVKVLIPFVFTGIAGFLCPLLLGGGHDLIMKLVTGGLTIKLLIFLLLVKFIMVITTFGSGVPGGIFFPLLVLGALIGDIFGITICHLTNIPTMFIMNFIILAMAGHFASIIKAPITGIVLIIEMTGSFDQLLSLAVVVLVSYIISDLLRSDPIYESLLDKLLKKKGIDVEEYGADKTVFEVSVEMGSQVEGKKIKDIKWPNECLLVAVKRGGNEIIPKGDTKILVGDYLVVLVCNSKSSETLDKMKALTEMKEIE